MQQAVTYDVSCRRIRAIADETHFYRLRILEVCSLLLENWFITEIEVRKGNTIMRTFEMECYKCWYNQICMAALFLGFEVVLLLRNMKVKC